MNKAVVIIDYGMGNLLSVQRGLEARGAQVKISSDPDVVALSDRLVLPGVGAFESGMAELKQAGLIDAINQFVTTGRPLLGICLGMQMLLTESEEFGQHAGLNLIPGRVVKIPDYTGSHQKKRKIPCIGWSSLKYSTGRVSWSDSLLSQTEEGEFFYFVHSYMAVPDSYQDVLAESDYRGTRIVATVCRNNVMGCQFHPEKSGEDGLKVLNRFLQM